MADLLKRGLAPLTEEAWQEIDETAGRVLRSHLSARTVVDFNGPHGWDLAVVNLGRLALGKTDPADGVPWGTRTCLPLVEARIPCTVDQMEIDSVSRGSQDPDLSALEDAARKLARFEERAVYLGFKDGGIEGIIPASDHKAIKLDDKPDHYAQGVAEAVKMLGLAGVGGPYTLVLGTELYYPLMQAGKGGYPPRRIIRDLLGGEIVWSPVLEGGVVLSTRGGDFELTVGQDLSVGYASHDRDKIELFLAESFTFRVLDPAAAVELKPGS